MSSWYVSTTGSIIIYTSFNTCLQGDVYSAIPFPLVYGAVSDSKPHNYLATITTSHYKKYCIAKWDKTVWFVSTQQIRHLDPMLF